MTYILVDHPNPNAPQGSLPRRGGGKLSGTCIVHTSEGPWTNGVNALTSFIRTRSDYGSYHRACDWADIAVYFPWEWEAWQDTETNGWAVGIAAACRTSDWRIMPANIREGYYRNLARMAADFVTYMKKEYGVTVPLRRLTGAEARARVPGFAAHGDSGVHRSDPGADFDWAAFFRYTAAALGAANPAASKPAPAPAKASTKPAAKAKFVPDPHWRVDPGDTLGAAAKHFGVTVAALAKYNGIKDPNKIKVGERIWPPVGADTWKVEKGDTLSKIVAWYHANGHKALTLQKLQFANGINNPATETKIGLRLQIPK